MRKPLATLAFVSIAVVLLAVWFAARSSDDAVAVPRPNAPLSSTPAPAVEPPQPDAPRDDAPPAPRVEVGAIAVAPSALSEAPSTLAELRGRFVLPDGRPANGVALRLAGWEGDSERVMKHGQPLDWTDPETTTDADGRFTFRFDPPLAFQFALKATLSGHATVSWRWDSLPPREVTDMGEVALIRSGVVRGRVVDARGIAAPGAWHVYGEAERTHRDAARGATGASVSTDPVTGEFVLEGLPPGPAQLELYSRIANWIDGPRVEVRAGEELTADIVYDGPENSRRIVVVTFNEPFHVFSNPVSGSIVLHGAGEERVAKKIAGSSQSWSFEDLEPGAYEIEIRDPLFEPWRQSGVRTGTSVNAQLRANGAVQLMVVGPDRSLIEDYRLRLSFPPDAPSPDGARFSFSPSEFELRAAGAPLPPGGLLQGMIPADVAMDSPFEGLEGFPGPSMKRSSPHAFVLHVDAADYGTGEARVEGLGVGETRPVVVQLARSATISGRITGAPAELVEGVSVVLADAQAGVDGATEFVEGVSGTNYDRNFRLETQTDAEGRFSFDGLRPGSFAVVARFHHDFSVAREGLTLAAGESLAVTLEVGPHGAIEGRILAHAGDLENAWVEALGVGLYDPLAGGWSTFDGEPPPRAEVGGDGRFRFAPLNTGTYQLALHHSRRSLPEDPKRWTSRFGEGAPLGAVAVTAPEVASAEFDLSQRRRGTIHVQARIDGEPAVGWRVAARSTTSDSLPRTRRAHALVGADGAAHLELLEPGDWIVGLEAEDHLWSSWASAAAELTPGGELTLAIGVARHPGRITVLDAATGKPRTNTTLRWGDASGSARVTTDANGAVEFQLPIGTYTAIRGRERVTVEWTASGPVPAEIKL